ncbi:MAG TPA: nucleotide-binding protein [Terriglobales bacterium]
MQPKVVIETRGLRGSDDNVDLQRVATVYIGMDEYRVYAPPKATGYTLDWLPQMLVRQHDGTGETDVQGTHRAVICELLGKALQQNDQSSEASRTMTASTSIDSRRVFVVYGRNSKARAAVFDFLRAIDLAPMEWEEVIGATSKPSPYIGEALEAGFSMAQAAVVILTGDDLARVGKRYLKPDDTNDERVLTPQPRPNVLFEAGMALGKYPDRTVLVSLGSYRTFSDIDGRHLIRLSDNATARQALADRLRKAGCAVKTEYKSDWLQAGDFAAAIEDADVAVGKSRIRLKTFRRELRIDPEATYKRKIWIELKNESDECLLLRNPVWKTIPSGIHAAIRAGTFQLQLSNTWCPEKIGAQQVNLPPGDLCRLWAEPDEEHLDAQIKQLCRSDAPFGSVVLLANGEELSIPV